MIPFCETVMRSIPGYIIGGTNQPFGSLGGATKRKLYRRRQSNPGYRGESSLDGHVSPAPDDDDECFVWHEIVGLAPRTTCSAAICGVPSECTSSDMQSSLVPVKSHGEL